MSGQRAQVVVVGGGFAGLHALRRLERVLPPEAADLVLVNPTDHLVYSPLLPDVTASTLEPRHVAVSLRQALRRTRVVLGHARAADRSARTLDVTLHEPGAPARSLVLPWDRLVLAPGSVTRQFPLPGVSGRAHGIKTLTEAVFVRDHLLSQVDVADSLPPDPAHDAERRERLTVVAVGAGYTGTEMVAQTHRWLNGVLSRWTGLSPSDVRWVLIDLAPTVLPELGPRLGAYALRVLRERGIDVRLGVSVASVDDHTVTLTDGTVIPCRTLIWSAGIAASPLMGTLGLPLTQGRLPTDPYMRADEAIWAVGDSAAIPDLTRPGAPGRPTPVSTPTAQNAQRQGNVVGYNVAASLGHGRARPYRHHDLGLVADLGGTKAVARPLGIELTGVLAKLAARGYHLYALPNMGNRARVLTDWLGTAVLPPQSSSLSVVRPQDALISAAQGIDLYGEPAASPAPVESDAAALDAGGRPG
jgi:NADH:ubiquinone reductase (H+-translocating)